MKSVRDIVDSSPQLRDLAMQGFRRETSPQPLGPALWNWDDVKKVLVVRLRSIGDTVLSTPALCALKRFRPELQVDILLEDWVAPVLEGLDCVDNVVTLRKSNTASRARVARTLRNNEYDVVYNLHGGTTATLLTRATGAPHRVGYAHYQYARLHQHKSPSSASLWQKEKTHSVEQQLALLGWTGVPVSDRPPTRLAITKGAAFRIARRLSESGIGEDQPFVLLHPAAAFDTKQWPVEGFARVAEDAASRGLAVVAIVTKFETQIAAALSRESSAPVVAFTDLLLPEVTALAAKARLFVGNDSGIAHIAAAVNVPAVVIFGSSNVDHWAPWATAPAAVVREQLDCQPCHGYFCEQFQQPECIRRVSAEKVLAAIDRVLTESKAEQ